MSPESPMSPIPEPATDAPSRAGFVGMAGAPNAGKSTLVNRLVGQKIAITSACPQTTRHRLCAIWTEGRTQAVLVDMPGILESAEKFNRALVDCAEEALRGCDVVLHVRTASSAGTADELRTLEALRALRVPIWQVWNKIDLAPPTPTELHNAPAYERSFAVSARTGKGIGPLKAALLERMPEGPWLYPADELSDRDLRFLAAECVREKVFLHLRKEIPYSVATWTETWEEREGGRSYVRVVIQAERESHKQILIGKGGAMLRRIGTEARREIETLAGGGVYLELFVRIKPHWRRDDEELKRLGLTASKDRG